MTIHQFLVSQLVECGLWPDQAEQVMANIKGVPMTLPDDADYGKIKEILGGVEPMDKNLTAMKFDDPLDSYPKAMVALLLYTVKKRAIEWVDANAPTHFARALLAA